MPKLSWLSKWGYTHSKDKSSSTTKGGGGGGGGSGGNGNSKNFHDEFSRSSSMPISAEKKMEISRSCHYQTVPLMKSTTFGVSNNSSSSSSKSDASKDFNACNNVVDFCFNPHPSSHGNVLAQKSPKFNSNLPPVSSHTYAKSVVEETPPDTFNTWELAEALDDSTAMNKKQPEQQQQQQQRRLDRASTFHVEPSKMVFPNSKSKSEDRQKPMAVTSPQIQTQSCNDIARVRPGSIQHMVNAFQQIIDDNNKRHAASLASRPSFRAPRPPPGGENKVVLYFTTLRGIRKTFEGCCSVRLILQGFRVVVDERDVSMHAQFRKELQDILGKNNALVPRLFIGGKYVGGVEEVQQLHELGDLANLLEGYPRYTSFKPCDGCGDARFVPCLDCDGSCKIASTAEGFWIKCSHCNENGLIRCPICCS